MSQRKFFWPMVAVFVLMVGVFAFAPKASAVGGEETVPKLLIWDGLYPWRGVPYSP